MKAFGLAGIAVVAVALAPLAALASDQADALRLAQRVASLGLGTSSVALHALPKELPPSVPLPKATLLGSLARDMEAGMNGSVHVVGRPLTLYYDAPGARADVLRAYETVLRSAGWRKAALEQAFPIPRGGFTMQIPQLDAWCAPGDAKVAVSIVTPAADTAALDVSVNTQSGGVEMECGNVPQFMRDAFPKSPLPTFSAPAGVTLDASGPASDGTTTGARIESSLDLATVFEAFAAQLRAAGWSPGASAAAVSLRSQTFNKTVDGKAWVALLALHALDATHYVALADVSPRQ